MKTDDPKRCPLVPEPGYTLTKVGKPKKRPGRRKAQQRFRWECGYCRSTGEAYGRSGAHAAAKQHVKDCGGRLAHDTIHQLNRD